MTPNKLLQSVGVVVLGVIAGGLVLRFLEGTSIGDMAMEGYGG